MIRTAFLGAVRHATAYAAEFGRHPRFSVMAVSDDLDSTDWRTDRARHLARVYQVPYLTTAQLLERADVDLVVITSEPTRHAALAIRALEAGKNVMIDKPVATTASDARALAIAAGQSRGRSTYVHRLFSPAIIRLRSLLESGALGVPRTVHLTWISGNEIEDEGGDVIVDPALSGGGELWNFLGYPLDSLDVLTGLEIQGVATLTSSVNGSRHRDFGVESLASVLLELEENVLATVLLGRSPRVGDLSTITVVGSHGYAAIDEGKPAIDVLTAQGKRTSRSVTDTYGLSFRSLLDDLANAIDGNSLPMRSVPDGCAVAETIARAAAAAKK